MRPRLFLGSSSEGLPIARALKSRLDLHAEVVLWEDAFNLGDIVIGRLCGELGRCDFAVLVARGDDLAVSRGLTSATPRDNVLFEAGLFIGRLGLKRAYFVCDRRPQVKIPTDLGGVTFAMFDSHPRKLHASLDRVGEQIADSLKRHERISREFLPSCLNLIVPEEKTTLTFAELLERNCDRLQRELGELVEAGAWNRIVEVAVRLREFFEYSGLYPQGADCGKVFERAFRETGRLDDADWTLVKHVAYLQILANEHEKAEPILERLIASDAERKVPRTPTRQKLLFYAHRYLGISHQRKRLRSLSKAKKCFQRAQRIVDSFDGDARDRQELEARLLCNLGNLELDLRRGRKAIGLYRRSLQLFEDLGDEDHIGIAHLHMAKAIVKQGGSGARTALPHLHMSQLIAARLGWLEGQGRVEQQFALCNLALSDASASASVRRKYLVEAKSAARRALAVFDRMRSDRWRGRILTLLEELERREPLPRRRRA
jgi:tetratricopeptide (TPR) repeat protein